MKNSFIQESMELELEILSMLIPEECICDVYSLQLIFQYMERETGDYHILLQIQSYIATIINFDIIKINLSTNFEFEYKYYLVCHARVISVINILKIILCKDIKSIKHFIEVEKVMNDVLHDYSNFYESFVQNMNELKTEIGFDFAELEPWSNGWKDCLEESLSIIRKI